MKSGKQRIVFRADGNPEIGLGHVYRSLALAEMLKEDFELFFLIKEPIKELKDTILQICDKCKNLARNEKKDEEKVLTSILVEDDIVVLDGYQFDAQYQRHLRQAGITVVSIDDIHSNHFMSDVVINHAPGISKEDYSVEGYTKVCLGPDYALLRSNFIELTTKKNSVKKLETAFICFGGSDPNNLTVKSLQVLEEFEDIKEAIVITGAGYKNPELIASANSTDRLAISHYHDVDDHLMAQLMRQSDFAIVPSSTILYEVLAARLPVITGYFIDNQKNIYNGFLEAGAVLGVGELSTKHIREGISKLTVVKSTEMVSIQEELIDGKSPKRILELFQQLSE